MVSQDDFQDGESIKSSISRNDHNADAVRDKKTARMAAYPSTEDDHLERAIIAESEQRQSSEADDSIPNNDTLSDEDSSPPPDGGLTAWTQCLCAHLTNVTTFG
jgi:hypothetical protein